MHLWILQKEGIEEYLEILQHDYLGIRANSERMWVFLLYLPSQAMIWSNQELMTAKMAPMYYDMAV